MGFADEALDGVMTGTRLRGLLDRTGVRSGNRQNDPVAAEIVSAIKLPGHDPDLQKPGQIMPENMHRLLADDVCRHVHQGWFGRALWLGGVL